MAHYKGGEENRKTPLDMRKRKRFKNFQYAGGRNRRELIIRR